MVIHFEAKLKLVLDRRLANCVKSALRPNDTKAPKDFTISYSLNNEFTYEVRGSIRDGKDLLTLLSIIDEVTRLVEMISRAVRT